VKEWQTYLNITVRVIANFLLKFISICYHDNKGRSGRRLNDTAKWAEADPKTPDWSKYLGSVLSTSRII